MTPEKKGSAKGTGDKEEPLPAIQPSNHGQRGGDLLGATQTAVSLAQLVKQEFGVPMRLNAALQSHLSQELRYHAKRGPKTSKYPNTYPPASVPQGPQATIPYKLTEDYKIYRYLQDMPRCVQSMLETPEKPEVGPNPLNNIIPFCMHHIDGKTFGGQCVLRQFGGTTMYSVYIGYNPSVVPDYFQDLSDIPDSLMQATILSIADEASGIYCVAEDCMKVATPLPVQDLNDAMKTGNQGQPLTFLDANRCLAGFLFLRALAEAITTGKHVLIWEDGGYLNPIIDQAIDKKTNPTPMRVSEFRARYHIPADAATDAKLPQNLGDAIAQGLVGSVELTRNGYDSTMSLYQARGGVSNGGYLNTPFFSIAASYEKIMLEGDNITLSCLDGLDQVLYRENWSLSKRNVVVLGARGNLGRRFCKHLLDVMGPQQVVGTDIKLSWPAPGPLDTPPWQTPWNAPVAGIQEYLSYKDIPADFRRKTDVIFGWTGGPATEIGTGKRLGTFDGDDLCDWLLNGTPQVLFLASGSTKTSEFEDVLAYLTKLLLVEKTNRKIGSAPVQVDVYSIADSLTMAAAQASHLDPMLITRDFGVQWVFTFPKGVVQGPNIKCLFLVNNTMPVNFMFYGTPTEIMDMTYAQVTAVAGKVGGLFSKGRLQNGIHPTDYDLLGTEDIIEAQPLTKDYNPPPSNGIPAVPASSPL